MSSSKYINCFLNSKNYTYILVVVFLVGITTRIVGISSLPSGLNQDEASIGYEAFSILNYGIDRNSMSFPIHLIAWGNGQNALYAYLSMPFISIFGLNTFSVRIVNSIFSILSMFVFFSIFKLIFDKKKALVALGLLAICPWSIMSSRWGLESNIFPTLLLIAIFFLLKGIKSNSVYIYFSFFFFALSLYAYGTSYLIVPVLFVFILPFLFLQKSVSKIVLAISLGIFAALAVPIFLFVLINHFDFETIKIGLFSIPKLESNRTTEIFNLFNGNFILEIGKNTIRMLSVIFTQTDGTPYNSIPMFGTIYPVTFPFFAIGFYNVVKKMRFASEAHNYFFCIWFFCNIVLGITSNVNINRINSIFYPILYFAVLGLFDVKNYLRDVYLIHYRHLMIVFYLSYFLFFTSYYFLYYNKDNDMFCYGLEEAIHFAEKKSKSSSINISPASVNMPYIYACFYNEIDPAHFNSTVRYDSVVNNGFRKVLSFGKYTFNNDINRKYSIQILNKSELTHSLILKSKLTQFGNYVVLLNK